MEWQSKAKFLINLTFYLSICAIVYISSKFLLNYLLPFVIAAIIAYSVQKPAQKISLKLNLKKNIVAALLSAFLFFIAAAVIIFTAYKLITLMSVALNEKSYLEKYIKSLIEEKEQYVIELNGFNKILESGETYLNSILHEIRDLKIKIKKLKVKIDMEMDD